jgi:hypothetical protein
MRMWMIDPKLLCQKHLLGEHCELHKHLHNFHKGHSVKGRYVPVIQIELCSLQERHDALAKEMAERGYNHQSPLNNCPTKEYLEQTYPDYYYLRVDTDTSLDDLCQRCPECKQRILYS